ncbi:MAG: hypothetical protein KA172_04215 [Paludibacter sp.]|jgi:hypothetical protein|nr:hypothetical protein [Paludibacter sp.]MBP7612752.1 hypothetical protein [Paludibacter sp.]
MPIDMVYCNNTTENHHLSLSHKDCLLSLNEMIRKENKNKACSAFDNSWIVLDLDSVEIKKAQKEGNRNRNATCDCTAGVKKNNAPKMLLIECRLNYESVNGITEGDLDSKVRGSIALMGQDPAILNTVYFVFKDKVQPQALRKLRTMKSNRKEYIAVTINGLKNAISA